MDHQVKPDLSIYSKKELSKDKSVYPLRDMETSVIEAPMKNTGDARDTRGQLITYPELHASRTHGLGTEAKVQTFCYDHSDLIPCVSLFTT
jgi:hypothetical protein